jgi:hypothetical protein
VATTTTNFNFPIPQSTDLVKDGATAIAALGTSIDTDFVDLKGGTTGQVLSKASGTDLDFTWVAQDDSNAIQNAIVDAKGDLIGASAADTPARLAVGGNGEILVADSSTSTGLRWQSTTAAGKNFLINGAMEFAQRGTSVSAGTANVYGLDRWYTSGFGTGQPFTIAQGTSNAPTGFRYYQSVTQTSANSTNIFVSQSLETTDVIRLAGKTATLSFLYKIPTNSTSQWSYNVLYSTATDGNLAPFATRTSITSANLTNTTSWTSVSATFAVPSNATSFAIEFATGNSTVNNANFQFTGVQVEIASVATAFTRAGGTIQGELAACQRYYTRFIADNTYTYFAIGSAQNVNSLFLTTPMPVPLRIAPTSIDLPALSNFFAEQSGVTSVLSLTSITLGTASRYMLMLQVDKNTSFTVGTFYRLLANGTTSAYIGVSAEL